MFLVLSLSRVGSKYQNLYLFIFTTVSALVSVSGGRNSLVLDYLPYLSKLLSEPLVNEGAEGVDDVVKRMHAYDLLREDFDNIMDLASFSDSENLREMIDSKVNALC